MTNWKIIALVVLTVVLAASPGLADLQIFELQHRPAEELVPLLREQVGEGTRVSGSRKRIVANGSVEDLALVKQVLDQLDVALPQYQVRVRQSVHRSQAGTRVGGAVRLGTGPDSVTAHGQYRLGTTSESDEQTLMVLEGEEGFFFVGEDRPYTDQWAVFTGETEGVHATTAYRTIRTGFMVRPLRSDKAHVWLEVVPQMQRMEPERNRRDLSSGPHVTFHQSGSTVKVPIGEWFPLARNLRAGDAVSREVLVWRTGNKAEEREVWIFLEKPR